MAARALAAEGLFGPLPGDPKAEPLSPVTLVAVMTLIVAGGIGFLTLEELHLRRRRVRSGMRFRLSVHSRLVLLVTSVLLLGSWALFTVFEWRVSLAVMPVWARPLNSLFMSVTARTAGFNTVDYDAASTGSNFLTIILMSIGGSPGSAAGGIKTTTVALIGILAWSRFRGREVVHAGIGNELLRNIAAELQDLAKVERPARLDGKRMTMVLSPIRRPDAPKAPSEGERKKSGPATAEP